MNYDDDNYGCLGCLPLLILFLMFFVYFVWLHNSSQSLGINGFGPVRQYDAVVVSKHIDAQRDSSSYMVATDSQVFEVDNGPLLGMWNADVVYGSIVVGQRYCFTAKGNQVTDWFFQQYPYILKAVPGGCDG